MGLKVSIDADRCTGHGRCYAIAPQLFAPDVEGLNAARGSTVDVADEDGDLVRAAARGCPERAIAVH